MCCLRNPRCYGLSVIHKFNLGNGFCEITTQWKIGFDLESIIKNNHRSANHVFQPFLTDTVQFFMASGMFDPSTCSSPMQQQNTWDKKGKYSHQNENQAPYHVISQCFYVYVLSEGGHSVKKEIQQKNDKTTKCTVCIPFETCHVYSFRLFIFGIFEHRVSNGKVGCTILE